MTKLKYFEQLTFDCGSITKLEYIYLTDFCKANAIESVLEIGCGASTFAFMETGCSIRAIEGKKDRYKHHKNDFDFYDKIELNFLPYKQIKEWPITESKYDLAFVNAPQGTTTMSRYDAVVWALGCAKTIILHDAKRKGEQETISKILSHNDYKDHYIDSGRGMSILHKDDITIPSYKQSLKNNKPTLLNDIKPFKKSTEKKPCNDCSRKKLKNKKNDYAIFVCSNQGYMQYANVLLNSIDKYKLPVDVYFMHYDFNNSYIEDIKDKFNFNIIPIEIKRDDFVVDEFNKNNKNLFIKQSRFKYIRELGLPYKAICMLDADMFVTTPNFMNLFDLVSGTEKLIACNEKYKWVFNNKYTYQNKPIFDNNTKAHKFHCSVPIFFDLNKWTDVFDYYNQLAYNAFEVDDNGTNTKPIGDIFCWNISVYKNNRQNDIVLFPMETMAQVHSRYFTPGHRIYKENNLFLTESGDEVFSIHGRIGNKSWYDGQIRSAQKMDSHIVDIASTTLKMIQKEWYDLNVNHKLNIYDYMDKNDYWESIKGDK